MIKQLLIITTLCIIGLPVFLLADKADIWQQANQSYDDNEFVTAIEGYRTVLERGNKSAIVYYNLGCAYFKDSQIGLAIASFRHSLKSDPSFAPARENLEYARRFVIDKVEQKPRGFLLNTWYTMAGITSPQNQFILTIFAYWLLCLVLTFIILGSPHKEILIYLLILLAIIFIMGVTLTHFAIDDKVNTDWGVVTVASVELREGPGEDFEKIFTGHEGLECKIISRRQEYYLIELVNGLKGWIEKHSLTEI